MSEDMQSRFREIFVMMARYADELHEPVRSISKRSRLKHLLRMKDRLPELSRLEQVLGIGNRTLWLRQTGCRLLNRELRSSGITLAVAHSVAALGLVDP